MEDTIIAAIDRRRVLAFTYEDQPRIVNPHALYVGEQLRQRVLHAWQTAGESNTRHVPCWGNFHLAKMAGLVALDETFAGPQPDFNPGRFHRLIHSL